MIDERAAGLLVAVFVLARCGSNPSASNTTAGGKTTGDAGNDTDGAAATSGGDANKSAPDASTEREAGSCVVPGMECTVNPGSCCSDSACVGDKSYAVCTLTCLVSADCPTNCCVPLQVGGSVCGPSSSCGSLGMVMHCPDLKLLGSDGVFLGDATSDPAAANGVCNPIGTYGSKTSPTSIHDTAGMYGSSASSLSAYNTMTLTPPVLYCTSSKFVVAAVSKNTSKNTSIMAAIDPDFLCQVLASNRY